MLDPEDTPIDQLPLNAGVHLLAYNEDGLVALEKPLGALSHPNVSGDNRRSLLVADYDARIVVKIAIILILGVLCGCLSCVNLCFSYICHVIYTDRFPDIFYCDLERIKEHIM